MQSGPGASVPDRRTLALNLSFVLHEPSHSSAVRSAVRACQSHARDVRRWHATAARPASRDEFEPDDDILWLTLTIGLPDLLAAALEAAPDRVLRVDEAGSPYVSCRFFRAPARLALPDDRVRQVGVAALIARPDRHTTHLAITGIHIWPAERDDTVRSLERLAQAHAGQWSPKRTLWPAPAEILLRDEVY